MPTSRWKRALSEQWEKEPIAVIATLVGLVALFITGFQWWDSRQGIYAGLRAYMQLDRVGFTAGTPLAKDQCICYQGTAINTGQTPAVRVRNRIKWLVVPIDQEMKASDLANSTEVIGSRDVGKDKTDDFSGTSGKLSEADYTRIMAPHPKYILRVIGQINYADIFGDQHTTDFCAEYVVAALNWGPCSSFNNIR